MQDSSDNARVFTIICRNSFSKEDFKNLQIASDRILATGDNSAIEAFCVRCDQYFYEFHAASPLKVHFWRQQIEIARLFSLNLAELIRLFGENSSDCNIQSNYFIDNEQSVRAILLDPGISEANRAFCSHIIENFPLEPIFEGALKRSLWTNLIPDLFNVEMEGLDEEFKEFFIQKIQGDNSLQKVDLCNFPLIKENISRLVGSYNNFF